MRPRPLRWLALFLAALCAARAAPAPPVGLSLKPLHEAVLLALTASAGPPAPPCAYPEGAVVLTYATRELFPLLTLQRRALELTPGARECVEARTVTLCLDAACAALCALHEVPNCAALAAGEALARVGGAHAAGDYFNASDYRLLIWLKHELIAAALQQAQQVFFLDADALLFGDPFSAPLDEPPEGTAPPASAPPYDVRFQAELGAARGCGADANGGQLLVRRGARTDAYFEELRRHREEVLSGVALDQAFILPALRAAGASFCALDARLFAGACGGSHLRASSSAGLLTFHASCLHGVAPKAALLNRFIRLRKAQRDLGFVLSMHGFSHEGDR